MTEKTLLLTSDSHSLNRLRNRLRTILQKTGLSPQEQNALLLAVGEACTNAIRHSYAGESGHRIRLTIHDFSEKVRIKIRDYGRKFDVTKLRPPKLPPQQGGGLGVHFIKQSVDEINYNTSYPTGNELVLTKYKKRAVR